MNSPTPAALVRAKLSMRAMRLRSSERGLQVLKKRDTTGVEERRLRDLAGAAKGQTVMEALESLLRRAAPTPDPQLEQIYEMTDRIATDSTILTVDHVAREFGSSSRSLQRVFPTYVGVGPKWMIRLYRIKEAAARIEDGKLTTWADLALRLGYADQAHFVNDFRRIIGRPPARYAGAIHRSAARFMDSSIPGSGIHDQ
jgi:AraC-like DNA-binding protein